MDVNEEVKFFCKNSIKKISGGGGGVGSGQGGWRG